MSVKFFSSPLEFRGPYKSGAWGQLHCQLSNLQKNEDVSNSALQNLLTHFNPFTYFKYFELKVACGVFYEPQNRVLNI